MPAITILFVIEGINFCWYAPDHIYVQFDGLDFGRPGSRSRDAKVLWAVNEALGGKVKAVEITSDDSYCQASIRDELTLDQLQALGWPVTDES